MSGNVHTNASSWAETPLERVSPNQVGLDVKKLAELYQFLARPDMGLHSFMILRHGKVACEGFWAPYAPEKPHTLFSASKTFTGLAVGFAVQEGKLSLEDRVVDWFPERLPSKHCENMEKMKVKHLLTMSTGFAKDPHDFPWPRPDDVLATGPHCCHQGVELPQIDWVRNFFNHYVAYEPGTEFVYCTHGTYMLSVIVQKAVGETVSQYLNRKLFTPMGISNPSWETGPDGYSVGGWGLMLTTEQLAKVGQMMLDGGRWEGKEILSPHWIKDATSVHVTMEHLDEPDIAGYGYQMWIDRREGCYLFRGAFGQICAVIPGKDMVIAYTGGSDSQARRDAWEKIWELAVESAGTENLSTGEDDELKDVLASLSIPTAQGRPSWQVPEAAQWSGKVYVFGDNRLNFSKFSMTFAQQAGQPDFLTLGLAGESFTVPVGYRTWLRGKTCVKTEQTDTDVSIIFEHVSCSGAWENNTYHLVMCFDETSYINTISVTFLPGGVLIQHRRNCTFFSAVNADLTGVELPEKAQ